MWALVAGLRGVAAWVARVGVVIFVLFYDIGDAVAGIATGILAGRAASGALPEDVAVLAIRAIFTDLTKDVFFRVGISAWILALAAAAIALWGAGAPRLPAVLLAVPAYLLTFDRTFPFRRPHLRLLLPRRPLAGDGGPGSRTSSNRGLRPASRLARNESAGVPENPLL